MGRQFQKEEVYLCSVALEESRPTMYKIRLGAFGQGNMVRAVLGGINTFLFGVIDLRRDVYQQYNGTTISLYGGVVLRWATLKIRKSTREREGKKFLFKEAQFPAGIKMWRQLWLKRTRPLDYTHREGTSTMDGICKLVDGHEEGSQEEYESDGSHDRLRKKTKKPYKETELGVNEVPLPASMSGVEAKENE